MSANTARKWDYSSRVAEPTKSKQVKVRVKKNGWITTGEKILYSVLGTATILAGAYIISFSSSIDQLNRDVQSLEDTILNQTAENEGLMFEINELSDPARITKIARDNGLEIQFSEVKRVQPFNNN